MKSKFLILLFGILLGGFVAGASIGEDLHLNIQTTDGSGNIVSGTFKFEFNISTASDCGSVIYSNHSTLTTDSRGIVSYYLEDVNLNFSEQYWLCYYRDGDLINASQIARSPYTYRALNISSRGIEWDANSDLGNYNLTTTGTGFFGYLGSLGSRITGLFVQDVDFTGMINGSGNINTTGNVTADYFFGDGSQLTNINSSEISLNATQMEISEGELNILESWFSSLFDSLFTAKESLFNQTSEVDSLNLSVIENSNRITSLNSTITDSNESWLSTYNATYEAYAANSSYGDIFVNESGDTMTGALQIDSDNDYALNVSGDLYVNGSNGNVGIGTTAPRGTLDIYGTSKSFYLGGSKIASGASGNDFDYEILGSEYVDISGDVVWRDRDASYVTRMSLTSATGQLYVSGNVGIGTSSPQQILDIGDGDDNNYIRINRNGNSDGGLEWYRGSASKTDSKIYMDSDENLVFETDVDGSTSDDSFYFKNNGTDLVVIQEDGNVGIGTSSPSTLLDISGTNPVLTIREPVGNTGVLGDLSFMSLDDGSNEQEYAKIRATKITVTDGGEDGALDFYTAKDGTDTLHMRIDEDGNVGIGTSSPTHELTVEGDANITGTLYVNGDEVVAGSEGDLNVNNSDFLNGYNASYFMPLNKSVVGDFDFNGGWQNGGLSISDGDLFAQTVYVYNISGLNVNTLSINGSILPPTGFDDTFDIGSSSLRWRDLYLSGEVHSNGTGDNYFLGNVGIGTSSPSNNLDIVSSGSTALGLESGTDGNTGIRLINDAQEWRIQNRGSDTDDNFIIWDITSGNYKPFQIEKGASTNSFYIDSSGNVGIGTSSPSEVLEVVGDLKVHVSDTAGVLHFGGISDDTKIVGYDSADGSNANNMLFTTGGSEAMRIVSSGNVGIGTTSPDGTLHVNAASAGTITANGDGNDLVVENNANGGISILVPDANNANLLFGSPSDGVGAKVQWNYDSGLMTIGSAKTGAEVEFISGNGVDAVRIDSSGNVGIGTSSPTSKLHIDDGNLKIYKDAAGTDEENVFDIDVSSYTYTDTDGDALWDFSTSASSSGYQIGRFRISDSDTWGSGEDDGSLLQLVHSGSVDSACDDCTVLDVIEDDNDELAIAVRQSVGGTVNFAVKPDGSVGIGTSSPEGKLKINVGEGAAASPSPGLVFDDTYDSDGDASANKIIFYNSSNWQGGIGVSSGDVDFFSGSNFRFYVGHDFDTLGTEALTILTGGNVGIGTSSPSNTLDVRGQGNFSGTVYINNGTDISSFANGTMNSAAWNRSGTDVYLHYSGDSVGIGTTAPNYKLEVGDLENVGNEGNFAVKSDSNAHAIQLEENSGSERWELGINSNGDLGFFDSGSTTASIAFKDGGNVGIGTDSPDSNLHVYSATTAYSEIEASSDNAYLIINSGTDGLGGEESGILFQNDSSNAWELYKTPAGDLSIYDYKTGTTEFLIDGPTGYVGIGTSSPDENFEVSDVLTGSAGSYTDYPEIRITQETDSTYNIGDIHGRLSFYSEDEGGSFPAVIAAIDAITTRDDGIAYTDSGLSFKTSNSAASLNEVLVLGDDTNSEFTGNLTLPDAGYVKSASGNNAIQIQSDGDVYFPGVIGIGDGTSNNAPIYNYISALSTAASHYQLYNRFTKTAGSTTEADDFYGIYNLADIDDEDSTVGHLYGGRIEARLTNGTIGDGGEDLRGFYALANVDDGTVGDDVFGTQVAVDIESAAAVAGSVYGLYVSVDDDAGASGTVYGLLVSGNTGVDYGIYQTGNGDNYFASDVGIGTISPTHELNVVGDANITGTLYVNGDDISEEFFGDIFVNESGDTMSGDLNMNGNNVLSGSFCPDGTCDVNSYETFTSSGIGTSNIYAGSGGEIDFQDQVNFNSNNVLNVDIDSGTIDGTTIGSSSPSTGIFTSVNGTYVGFGNTDAYFWSDASGRIATTADFYVQSTSGNTYLYSTNTYLGASSGDDIKVRDNELYGDDWIINYNEAGNWGIGTTTPDNPLEISGSLGQSGIHLDSTSGAGIFIDQGGITNAGGVYWQWDGADKWWLGTYLSGNLVLRAGTYASSDVITFQNSTGNVGIGTSSPSEKLFVEGNISSYNFNTTGINTYVGVLAGNSNTGDYLTATGSSAGYYNTGNYLTATGYNAGYGNNGTYVTATGQEAAYLNIGNALISTGHEAASRNTGNNVVAMGYETAYQNTGDSLTATGYQAAYQNTGISVTATGYSAAYQNTGISVTATGYYAGRQNIGNYLTATGYYAGYKNNGSYTTATGYYAGYNNAGSYTTATGYYAGHQNTGANVVATGYQAGRGNIRNDLVAIGYNAGYENIGLYPTMVGTQAGYRNNGTSLSAVGYQAGFQNTGNYIAATGQGAGYKNTGAHVTAMGYQAGYQNTGDYLTATGSSAGYYNTGTQVAAVGYQAGYQNSGIQSSFFGYYAGRYNTGDEVTTAGLSAGYSNTGDDVTAIGSSAGQSNTGDYLTSLGQSAGYENIGNRVTAIGPFAGNGNKGNDSVFLGYNAGNGNTANNQFIVRQSSANSVPLIQGDFDIGKVGINTSSPGYTLDVAGDIGYVGTITDYSDIRLKENITELESTLDKINSMKPVSFQMKEDSRIQLGFIAQDVQELFPETISTNSATGYLGIDYTQLVAPTIKAVQELNAEKDAEIEDLQEQILELKKRIEELEK